MQRKKAEATDDGKKQQSITDYFPIRRSNRITSKEVEVCASIYLEENFSFF